MGTVGDLAHVANKQSFYLVQNWARATPSGRKFLNMKDVCGESGSTILSPPSIWDRGFRPYAVRPRFRISKRLGRQVCDIEHYLGYWFSSDTAKRVLDTVSPSDFVYLPVDVEVDPGCDPAVYWLCDIVTILDAVDEARSERLRSRFNDRGQKLHNTLYASTVFDERIVGDHNVFRLVTDPTEIVCTERFKEAYKAAGLKGLTFLPAYEPPFETIGTITKFIPKNHSGRWSHGEIASDGRGKRIVFMLEAMDDPNTTPTVGQRVHVRGHRSKYPSGRYVADRVTKL